MMKWPILTRIVAIPDFWLTLSDNGLTFSDNEATLGLTLSDNGLTFTDNGSQTSLSAHVQ